MVSRTFDFVNRNFSGTEKPRPGPVAPPARGRGNSGGRGCGDRHGRTAGRGICLPNVDEITSNCGF